MEFSPETYTVQILTSSFNTIGAGFILSHFGLAVSCAHVIRAAGGSPGSEIHVRLYKSQEEYPATVLEDYWVENDDVALLQIEGLSRSLIPTPLYRGVSILSQHDFLALGFPELENRTGHFAQGRIGGVVAITSSQRPTLELEGERFERGMSGAAVLDVNIGRVVGMMNEYQDCSASRIAYAVPSNTIYELFAGLLANYLTTLANKIDDILGDALRLRDSENITVADITKLRTLARQVDTCTADILAYWQTLPEDPHKITVETITERTVKAFHTWESCLVHNRLSFLTGHFNTSAKEELSKIGCLATEALSSLGRLIRSLQ